MAFTDGQIKDLVKRTKRIQGALDSNVWWNVMSRQARLNTIRAGVLSLLITQDNDRSYTCGEIHDLTNRALHEAKLDYAGDKLTDDTPQDELFIQDEDDQE